MIRTRPSSGTRHLLVSTIALTAIQTAWASAQAGFPRATRRRAVLLACSLACVAWLSVFPAFAQRTITTVAGNGSSGFSGDGGPAVNALLDIKHFTGGVAADAAGNVYFADTGNHRVRKIDPSGIIFTVAGNGFPHFFGDGGPATNASLFAPTGLGVDAAGNLYIIDTGNHRVRKVSPNGIITTVAGNGVRGFSGDGGMATAASLSLGNVQYLDIAGYPASVAVDGAGNFYIADTDNGRVRKVNPGGIITTAITGLRDPYGVAADAVGNLFVTDSSNDQILKVTPGGTVTAVAGSLSSPSGLALDRAGNLFIADSHSHRARKVEPNGVTTIVAGSGDPIFDPIEGYYFVGGFSGDGGPATNAQLNFPWGVAVDGAGNIYIADSVNNRIRKVTTEDSGLSPIAIFRWSLTGNFNQARATHTATLLTNGKVLIAGGNGNNEFLNSLELYDANTETWSVTGSLNTRRHMHTATLLQNGKILVAGGGSGTDPPLNSAELYDPATGSCSTTGNLQTGRYSHTATLLPNGKVLVTGGSPSLFNATSSAELYDPATETWSITNSLSMGERFNHTATLLANGKVLVAGGGTDDGVNNVAELYDPATGIWTVTGSLTTPRSGHTATLLPNGKVLVAGGNTFSGSCCFAPTDTAELYDPSTGKWNTTGRLNMARHFQTATLLPDGKVLVAGGSSGNTSPAAVNTAELYDPSTGTWSFTSSLNAGRYWHTATLLPNGKVLIAGGTSNVFTHLNSSELYGSAGAPTPSSLQLSASSYTIGEGGGNAQVTVNRTDTSAGATVDYATSDGAALNECTVMNGMGSSRCDYATTIGTLHFASGEASKSVLIPLVDDAYAEGNESFSITLSNPVGATLGSVPTASITIQDNETFNGANPIENVDFFVRQHYIDFLGREPDPAGQGWHDTLNNCPPSGKDANGNYCDRIEVSSGFFRSPEFQARGYFIYRFYSMVGRIPVYEDFMPDFAKVSGFLSDQQLEANKVAFVEGFMARAVFQNKYSSTFNNRTAYVDALLQTVSLPGHPSRGAWIDGLTNQTLTKAQVLRSLVESAEVYQKYYYEAFVIMQYFAYLRRTADASYLNWIQTMSDTGGDYRVMINGFMNSVEYRRRFGP